MIGVVMPFPGKKAGDVITGLSGGASGGDGVGAEAWGNANGIALGVGATTPGFNVVEGSVGVKLFPKKAAPSRRAVTPHRIPR